MESAAALRRRRFERVLGCPRCHESLRDFECSCGFGFELDGEKLRSRSSDEDAGESLYFDGLRGRLRRNRFYPLLFRLFSPVLVREEHPELRFQEVLDRDGLVVDVGAGNHRRDSRIVSVDLLPFPEVDIVTTAEGLPFRDATVDGLVSTVVLEHVPDPFGALDEFSRVLRPSGEMYLSVPFLQPFHAAPHDYHRWTLKGITADLEARKLEVVESGVLGGAGSTLAWFLGDLAALVLSFGSEGLRERIKLPLQACCSPIKLLDLILNHFPGSQDLASLIYVVARRIDD